MSKANDGLDRLGLQLVDVPDEGRYVVALSDDGTMVANVTYRLGKGWIALLHTEVQSGFEGQGMGGRTASLVFDDARSQGLKVVPKCPFIVRWLERHPEHHDALLRPLAAPDSALGSSGSLDMS